MKGLFAALSLCLLVSSIEAGFWSKFRAKEMPTKNSSWSTIKKDSRLSFDEPSVRMEKGGGFNTSVFFLCQNGDRLRTIKKVSTCIEWDGRISDDEPICVKRKRVFASTKIETTRSQCVEYKEGGDNSGDCIRYAQLPTTIPTNYLIPVYKLKSMNPDRDLRRARGTIQFKKSFRIPHCN